jgi:hypothetical protein
MIKDWSKDRSGENPDKKFHLNPDIQDKTWAIAYDFLHTVSAVIQKHKHLLITCRPDFKSLITTDFVTGKYHKMKCNFDDFMLHFKKVRLITLDKNDWAKSKCTCGWFLKHYSCYHIIAIAANEGLIEIPTKYKNVSISAKPKRGRKAKAKSALL